MKFSEVSEFGLLSNT